MMKNALDTIQELSNLIQFSPKRSDFFEWMRLSFDLTGGALRPLCPTRWSAKAKSFEWVLHNYDVMLEILLSIAVGNDGVTCLEVERKQVKFMQNSRSLICFSSSRFKPSFI